MRKILFAALVLITAGTATAQSPRFQNDYASGISVGFLHIGVDPTNPPEYNCFASINNENDFEVHATLTLFTDAQDLARTYDIVIPANAYDARYPLGLIYWTEDWQRLAGKKAPVSTWLSTKKGSRKSYGPGSIFLKPSGKTNRLKT